MRVDTETRRHDGINGKARKRVTKLPCREHLRFLLGRCLSLTFLYPGFLSGNQLLAQSWSRRVSSADRECACDLGWPIRALLSSDMAPHAGGRGAACGEQKSDSAGPGGSRKPSPECSATAGQEVRVARSCPTLGDAMDYTVYGLLQVRHGAQVSRFADGFFTSWAIKEAWARDTRFHLLSYFADWLKGNPAWEGSQCRDIKRTDAALVTFLKLPRLVGPGL